VIIYGHGNAPDGGRDIVNVIGQLNSEFQYMTKQIDSAYTGMSGGGLFSEKGTLYQSASTGILDGFRSTEHQDGTETSRIFSAFDLGYSGSLDSLPDPRSYYKGAGAGRYIFTTFDVTECWDSSFLVDPSACAEHDDTIAGQNPREREPVTIEIFSGPEAIDCASIRPEVSFPLNMADHTCSRFLMEHERIDCIDATQGEFTVTASVGGTSLSSNPNAPSSISSASKIILTSSYAAYPESFYPGSILIQPYTESIRPDWPNKVALGTTAWNSSFTQFTFSPELQSGTTYLLRIFGVDGEAKNSNTVRSAGVGGNPMAESRLYYFTVP
jgi:hypothetical protein